MVPSMVGYMSCVPCDMKFIIVISRTRYTKRFQYCGSDRRYVDQSVRCSCHAADSFTLERMNSDSSAGRPPRKNIIRQPLPGYIELNVGYSSRNAMADSRLPIA